MKTLVIGIGNTIRCDDGIGFKLAQMVEKETIEGVEVICTHQLLPELSEDISKYEVVIFVDASTLLERGKIAFE
ncbi:MAG: hydrogenase maturation protease, partial [Campylobacterales bacterium]